MYKFFYKKMLELLDARTKKINDSIQHALDAKNDSIKLYHKCVEEFKRVQEESLKMKEQAKSIGLNEKEKIVAEAAKNVETLLAQTKKDISQEVSKAKEELKKEISNFSLGISEKIMEEGISAEQQQKLTEKYLKEIEAL